MTAATTRVVAATGALGLTLAVTWPLARCFGVCLGASEDPLISVYFLRWVSHSLATPGARLLDAGIFAPYSGTLALGEYMPAYAVVALPAIAITGNPVVAHNAIVVLAYTLAGLGAAVLAARLVGAGAPALVAGLVFAYSPRLLHQAHNLQALSAFWFPWLFLAFERVMRRPTWTAAGAAVGVGLGLALSSASGFLFAGVAGLVVITVALGRGARRLRWVHLVRVGGMGVLAAAVLVWALAPYRALARGWGLARTLAENEQYSVAPGDYLGVPPEHLLHRLLGIGRVVDLDHEALFPGITVATLALIGLVAVFRGRDALRPALVPYVAMAAVAALLALGPTAHTAWGPLPLPYRALYAGVPGFDLIRAPRRFVAFAALGLALLAAAGAGRLLARLPGSRGRVALGGLSALVLIESIAVPFPGTVRRLDLGGIPEVYRWLATQAPRTLALELPMRDEWEKVAAAAFHLRRTVNGWSSYTPPHYYDLAAAMDAFPGERSLALIEGLRVDLLLLDRDWLGPVREAALEGIAPRLRLERVIGSHLVYRPGGPTPPGPEQLWASAVVASSHKGPGSEACVTLENPGPGFVPLYPLRRVRLRVEGEPVRASPTAENWLPLDLAPGFAHTTCVGLRETVAPARIHGEVEGAGHVHRFVVTPDGPPRPLVRRRRRRSPRRAARRAQSGSAGRRRVQRRGRHLVAVPRVEARVVAVPAE